MKAIAEETKSVAILTQKDSTNMRIITAITLIFLPGTFVAVSELCELCELCRVPCNMTGLANTSVRHSSGPSFSIFRTVETLLIYHRGSGCIG